MTLKDNTEIPKPPSPTLVSSDTHCNLQCEPKNCRSEGFPERDIWSLGTLDQGSAGCPELLGRRRRRRRHLEIQVDIQARELLLKVFLRFWGRGERYRRMETGVLLRISIRIQ